jgi:hypothetical protein
MYVKKSTSITRYQIKKTKAKNMEMAFIGICKELTSIKGACLYYRSLCILIKDNLKHS